MFSLRKKFDLSEGPMANDGHGSLNLILDVAVQKHCTELFYSYAGVHEIFYYLLNPLK